MKTDITDKIPTDLRDRWLKHFEDNMAFQDTMERILTAHGAIMRRGRLNERALWKELVSVLNISSEAHDRQLSADLDSQRLFLTGLELPKPAEPTHGQPNAPQHGQVV